MEKTFLSHFSRIFLPLIPLIAVVFYALYKNEIAAIERIIEAQDKNKTQLSLNIIESHLYSLEADALFLSGLKNLSEWLKTDSDRAREDLQADMMSYMTHYPHYDQIRLLNNSGHEIVRINNNAGKAILVPQNELQDKSSRYYVKEIKPLKNREIYISVFDLNIEHGKIEQPLKPILRVGTPIYINGDLQGSLFLNYLGAQLLDELRKHNSPDRDREIWLLNEDGYFFLGPSANQEWGFMFVEGTNKRFSTLYPDLWAHRTSSGTVRYKSKDNILQITPIQVNRFLHNAKKKHWYVVTKTSKAYLDLQAKQVAIQLSRVAAFILAILAISCWMISKKEMARKQSEIQLRESEKQFRHLLQGAPDAIIVVNQHGIIQIVNDAATHVFHYSREDMLNQSVEQLLPDRHREKHVYHRENYLKNLAIRPMGEGNELRARRKDGSEFPVEISLSPLKHGHEIWVTAIIRDVSIRHEHSKQVEKLNNQLLSRSAELETINKELEAFSYSVSHDLRAPLRAIDGFSKTVLRDYMEKLDDRGQDRLERIRAAAQKMGNLIDDMLVLSRISRAELHKEEVDVALLSGNIIEELRQSAPDRNIDFSAQSPMTAKADSRLLSVALTNLLSNAWKFTSRTQDAYIRIYTETQKNKTVYCIQDNGAGFNMDYAEKLFGAFQRLHDTSEFPGTGIGLAITQRVIHKHGGRLWAQAEEGKGATFYFTLGEDEYYEA
ncbi:PAS domain S-box protein [Teredinibacter sp. KSP-S5-2]|uniref:sensor histidine kinase n=1 Tax=Teredinibacter sp. KSP-S5-2 TaxID=3034506 RepID=UPI0029344A7C|nr:PAS domain S-box protein [Teredinibacter sp. KSP-S5-2]WNO09941.1 PAS domain S-box protein [Teredinibacter sp. KSP-S5-2]